MFLSCRHFNLRMKRDTSLFSPDLKVEVSGVEAPYDPSHIYTGEIFGKSSNYFWNDKVLVHTDTNTIVTRETLPTSNLLLR